MILLLLALMHAAHAAPNGGDAPADDTDHATTDGPLDADGPADTDAPTDADAPTDTVGPLDTDGPADTDAPTVADGPADTHGPTDADGPADTDGPTHTVPSAGTGHDGPNAIQASSAEASFHGPRRPEGPHPVEPTDADHAPPFPSSAPPEPTLEPTTDATTAAPVAEHVDVPTSDAATDDTGEALRHWLPQLVPTLPFRGLLPALALTLLTIGSLGVSQLLAGAQNLLAPNGLLPSLASALRHFLRLLAAFFGLGVIAAILPQNLVPALPWVIVGGALALGWSVSTLLPDIIAGGILATDRKIQRNQWVQTHSTSGIVHSMGLRQVWVQDGTGRLVAVPNRELLQRSVTVDRGRWPVVEVELRVPAGVLPSQVRRVVEDAVLVSPWAAPQPPDMIREEQEPGRWRVRARVLEGRFADRFEGALREHVGVVLERCSRR